MFQKLYRNLESIGESLRKNSLEAAATQAQVHEVNDTLVLINNSINTQKTGRVRLYLQVANLCALALIVVMAGYYIFYASPTIPVAGNTLPSRAVTDMESKSGELQQKMAHSEVHLKKLDSLIIAEAQSLKELKALNRTAVRTLQNIRKQLAREEATGSQQATAPALANQP